MKGTLLFSGIVGLVSAANPMIVGLGSSYSAGPGLSKPIGKILQEKLEALHSVTYDFSNTAVSGSVLGDVASKQAPKLTNLKPDLIYMVSGGNDLNYVHCLGKPDDSVCTHLIDETEFKKRYGAALDAIVDHTNKDTSLPVYVVTYMTAIDTDSKCSPSNKDCPLNDSQLKEVKGIHDDAVDWTVAALSDWKKVSNNKDYNVKLIPMRSHSVGHHIGSEAPWINGHDVLSGAGGVAWHPNNAGAEAVAQYIYNDFISMTG